MFEDYLIPFWDKINIFASLIIYLKNSKLKNMLLEQFNNIDNNKKEFSVKDIEKLSFILMSEFGDIKNGKIELMQDDLELLAKAYNVLFRKNLNKSLDYKGEARMEYIRNILIYKDQQEKLFIRKNINLVIFITEDGDVDVLGILNTYKDRPDLLKDFFSNFDISFYNKIDHYQITALKEDEIKIITNNDINKSAELFKIRKLIINDIEQNKNAS